MIETAPTVDWRPIATFFRNCGVAVALAAAHQLGREARSPMHRHQWRQAQVEKLRHALEQLVVWQKPVIALTAESTAMHAEVERMRGVLAYIARGEGKAADVARRALAGESR